MNKTDTMLKHARNIFFSHWEEMLHFRLVVLKKCEHEDIHDLRVASRRFRSALYLLAPLCGEGDALKVVKDVRSLTRVLGSLRNLDEALFFFGSRAEGIALSELIARLGEARENEQRKVIKVLKGFKYDKLDSKVSEIVATITADSIRKRNMPSFASYLSTTSITLFESIYKHLPATIRPENTEKRHALRIAIKKWRYFLEIADRILERDYGAILELLKKYQTLLGSMNDMAVYAATCRKTGLTASELESVEQLLSLENKRLFDEFVKLVETEPISYTFLI